MQNKVSLLAHGRAIPRFLLPICIGLFWLFFVVFTLKYASASADIDMAIDQTAVSLYATDQYPFDSIANQLINTTASRATRLGDLDGDGDLDMVVGNHNAPNIVLLNNNGSFGTVGWQDNLSLSTQDVQLGDLDGDGDLDLVVGNADGATRIYSNDPLNEDGSLNLNLIWTETVSDDTRSLALGDVDGNGYMDLVVANWNAQNKIYLNDGGTFSQLPDWSDGFEYQSSAVDLGDMDGDGDLDIAFANMCPSYPSNCDPDLVYQNDTDSNLSFNLVWERLSRSTTSLAWGEMDGDGKSELAMVEDVYNSHKVYRFNSISGDFDLAWNSVADNDLGHEVSWGDANGDGRQDLIVGNSFDAPERLYLNSGNMLESTASWYTDDTITNYDLTLADVDNDGDQDLVGAFGNLVKIYTNKSHPISPIPLSIPEQTVYETRDIAWGDINGDGLIDLVEGNYGAPNQIYLNDGNGFLTATTPELGSANSQSVALGDFDFDGDLDLAVGNLGSANILYLNDGTGFNNNDIITFGGSEDTYDLAWADFDGDGDLDLITADHNAANVLYINNLGNQTFGSDTLNLGSDQESSRGVAWGDIDQDGDLDLAFANAGQPNLIFINEDGTFDSGDQFTFGGDEASSDVAWGDVDGDGDLDLAVSNQIDSNQLFCNEGGFISPDPCWRSLDTNDSHDLAWGDADGDGDLDLAVGNARGNSGGAVEPDKIYFNDGGALETASGPIWASEKGAEGWLSTFAVAWADVDQDGDLDLAAGGRAITGNAVSGPSNGRTRIYFNTQFEGAAQDNGQPVQSIIIDLYSSTVERTQTYQSDALANANFFAVPGIRDGEAIPINYTLYHPEAKAARFVRGFFSLDGGGQWFEAASTLGTQTTNLTTAVYPTQNSDNQHTFNWNVSQSGFFGQSDNVIFRLEAYYDAISPSSGTAVGTYLTSNNTPENTPQPLATAQTFPFRVRGNQVRVLQGDGNEGEGEAIVFQLPAGQLSGGQPIADSHGVPFETNSFGFLQGRGQLLPGDLLMAMKPIAFGGEAPEGLSFDGVDDFVDFGVVTETAVLQNDFTLSVWIRPENLKGLQYIISHERTNSDNGFGLALLNSGLRFASFGVHAYDSQTIALVEGEWVHIAAVMDSDNNVSFYINGEYKETVTHSAPAISNSDDHLIMGGTVPFNDDSLAKRFSGELNEVRIWQGVRTPNQLQLEISQSLPESDAPNLLAYWPVFEGQDDIIEDYSENDNTGYLGGLPGDFEASRVPEWVMAIPQDPTYVMYHTSAAPTETGLSLTAVPDELGIITLRIQPENTLTLYDLVVSLEWDARNDQGYMEQLAADIERASQILFDLTDGQAAFGDVRIFHEKDKWFDADIIIYASNNHRPNANLGGLVNDFVAETVNGTLYEEAYIPGQIRMGAEWNRFGNSSGTLGEDWPRALAHEFGHYALYLLDDYLGISNNLLIETNCTGTAMTDAYIFSEFNSEEEWIGECLQTLAELTTGRTDWQTIETFYPWMAPHDLAGPTSLPIEVTDVSFANVATPSEALATPFFGLLDESGAPLVFGESDAQAYLFKGGANGLPTDVVSLGSPNRDLIQARGAKPGDEICVYGRSYSFIGCHAVGSQERPFTIFEVADWQPEITVTPETSMTIRLRLVNETAVDNPTAQFIPILGDTIGEIQLDAVPGQAKPTYEAVVNLETPTPGGIVRFVADGASPRMEAITQFYLGSGWNINRPGFSINRPGFSINRPGFSINRPGFSINRPGFSAPMSSSDGQVIIFSIDNIFTDVVTYSLQSLTALPDLDEWLAPVGQAYRFQSQGDLPESSITFYYMQRDVPGSFETDINVYFQANGSSKWERLTTELDTYRNFASAPLMGNGTYLLAVTIVTPELQEGWNLFAYPNTDARPLPQALASIHDNYTSIYELQGNVWKLYDTTVKTEFEPFVNDLTMVRPLHTYWIYAITDTVPFIGIPDAFINQSLLFSLPPATYYGEVTTDGPTIDPDATIVATIDGNNCGQASLFELDDDTWGYRLRVAADVGNDCGVDGREITFTIDGMATVSNPEWDNSQAQYWPLVITESGEPNEPPAEEETIIFLPMVTK